MKKVFSAPSVIPCDLLKSMLDAEGIESMIKNEGGSTAVGRGMPVVSGTELEWAWPEVWVNDEDFETASAIAEDYQRNRSHRATE